MHFLYTFRVSVFILARANTNQAVLICRPIRACNVHQLNRCLALMYVFALVDNCGMTIYLIKH